MKKILFGLIIFMLFLLIEINSVKAWDSYSGDFEKMAEELEKDIKKYNIPALAIAVVNKDNVLFEKIYGDIKSKDQPFIIGSVSKSFTALAIMQLVENGKIKLNDSVEDYVNIDNWFVNKKNVDNITILDLLNHTSGITTYQTFGNLEITENYGNYVYANTNYVLLQLIIEKVSGMTYMEYISKNIFHPLNMQNASSSFEESKQNRLIQGYQSFFGLPIPVNIINSEKVEHGTWSNVSSGYITAGLSDMEKYIQMYLKGGQGIISKESISKMFYDSDSVMSQNINSKNSSLHIVTLAGVVEGFMTYVFILPEEEQAVIVLTNMNDYFVTNNLIGNSLLPFLRQEKKELSFLYIVLHGVMNAICLFLLSISLYPLFTIKKWKNKKISKSYIFKEWIRHLLFPLFLISLPFILGIPYFIILANVKDVAFTIFLTSALLLITGIYKFTFIMILKSFKLKRSL